MHTKQIQLVSVSKQDNKIILGLETGEELNYHSVSVLSHNNHPFFVPDHSLTIEFMSMPWIAKPLMQFVMKYYDDVDISLPLDLD